MSIQLLLSSVGLKPDLSSCMLDTRSTKKRKQEFLSFLIIELKTF